MVSPDRVDGYIAQVGLVKEAHHLCELLIGRGCGDIWINIISHREDVINLVLRRLSFFNDIIHLVENSLRDLHI
jgi:uncharacterized membrane protein YqaE (UPF0057 family)